MEKKLYQPQSGILDVPYQPDKETKLVENPPRFSWMPAQLDDDNYVLQISTSPDFSSDTTWTYGDIYYNFFTPDRVFDEGVYYWRYALVDNDDNKDGSKVNHSEWSKVRQFTIVGDLDETPLKSREERFAERTVEHPRLWLNSNEIKDMRKVLKEDSSYYSWDTFLEKSVKPWIEKELIPEPDRYPNNVRVAELWRKMYMDCQEVLYAIRHLSVAGVILEDKQLINKAKEWLFHVLKWDVNGTTSRDYNDEAAFRIAGALAWGYDWLYHELTPDERDEVRENLFTRTKQVATHIIERSKIHQVPYDSHSVRALSSVLTPCCIALYDEKKEAQDWLHYTVEYFYGLYSPWCGPEGGWAEGPMYWTTQMAYVTEALNLLRKYSGMDIYKRTLFQNTGDFPLYAYCPDTVRASFGDQSSLGDRPGLKTAFNIRQYAGVTGNGYYQWYYDQVKEYDTNPEEKFYNYGWWDFPFDDMMYKHDYEEIEAVEPNDIPSVKWFKDVGWVALHSKMHDPEDHIMFLTKSSPYGSVSHSHGDQNGFLLHAYGEPLAIESGYYVAFNSTMHMKWRRQTQSTNNILIDGKGQYADKNKVKQKLAQGNIEEVVSEENYHYIRSNATQAYKEHVPYIEDYTREVYFIDQSYFVIVDKVDLEESGSIDWLFHTLNEMNIKDHTFTVNGENANMEGRFVYTSSSHLDISQDNKFKDVEPKEVEGLPEQWHLTAKTDKAKSHRLVTLLVPMKKDHDKYVSYFLDDQDHGVHIYFTEDGNTQKIEVSKAYK